MLHHKQLTNSSQTSYKRITIQILLLFISMIITTLHLNAQYDPGYTITTPSPCVGECGFGQDESPWQNEEVVCGYKDPNGVICIFYAKFVWRRCNGQIYIQNQEIYRNADGACFWGSLEFTSILIDLVYKTAFENLINQSKAFSTEIVRCYVPGKCVKYCCYHDPIEQVDRAFLVNCNSVFTSCCYIQYAFSALTQEAFRISYPEPYACQTSPFFNNCESTYLYDGNLLNLIQTNSQCEVQCQ